MKFALHDAMLSDKITNRELGKYLHISEDSVRRLRNPFHENKMKNLQGALKVGSSLTDKLTNRFGKLSFLFIGFLKNFYSISKESMQRFY